LSYKHTHVQISQCILDNSNNKHIYTTPSGQKLESVTKMIGMTKPESDKQNLKKWREGQGEGVADYIMNTAAVIGTETHELNENHLNMIQKEDNFHLLSHAHHRNFIPYLQKINNIYGIEKKLYSESMKLAGTADCIAEYDGILSIIDYKTKRSSQRQEWMNDYFVQTTAYSEMWKELTGQIVKKLVILVSSEKNTFQEFQSRPILHIDELYTRVEKFKQIMVAIHHH